MPEQSTPRLLIVHPLEQGCMEALEARYETIRLFEAHDPDALLAQEGPGIRALAGGRAPQSLIAALPDLEIIAGFGVGYDRIDVSAARARSVAVTNTPDVLNDAVAELAIGLMIALARRLPHADRFMRAGRWPEETFGLTGELTGKTLGIVGLGRIGREIARRAQAMKMAVVYHGRHRQPDVPYRYYGDLPAMAREVDWLLAIAPGGPATAGMIERTVIEALGPQGALVNLGRGSLVDEAALLEALETGALGGAALDVFENEPEIDPRFLECDNVVLSPHQGSATAQTRRAMGQALLANLAAHFAGEPLPNRVA